MFLRSAYLACAALTLSTLTTSAPTSNNNVLYTLDNNQKGASIVALELSKNGTIVASHLTSTGGMGSSGKSPAGSPAIGSLFSNNAVVVSGNLLFTVNAGSNTVSMFAIDPASPMTPKLVGKPACTLGEFPVSVAYSPQLKKACVLNGGSVGGVTCFNADPQTGLKAEDKMPRSISQALNQTTPPAGPFATASDIQFNPSSSALLVTVKGDPTTGKAGYVYAWPVVKGLVGRTPVISQPKDAFVDFSISFLGSDYDFLMSDPAIGALIIGMNSNLELTTLQPLNITYQKAICWSYYAPFLQAVFLIDAAEGFVTAVSSVDGSILYKIPYAGTGAIDPVISGTSLYVVDQSNSIFRIDFTGFKKGKTPTQVQTYKPALPMSSNHPALLVGIDVWTASS